MIKARKINVKSIKPNNSKSSTGTGIRTIIAEMIVDIMEIRIINATDLKKFFEINLYEFPIAFFKLIPSTAIIGNTNANENKIINANII